MAGSLKYGQATASLIVGKWSASSRQNTLAAALKEWGTLRRTIHAARYLSDPAYRRKIARQLNKGESLHALRRDLHYAQQGTIGRPLLADQSEQTVNAGTAVRPRGSLCVKRVPPAGTSALSVLTRCGPRTAVRYPGNFTAGTGRAITRWIMGVWSVRCGPGLPRSRQRRQAGMCRGCGRAGCQIQPRERASWTASWRLAAPSLAAAEER
jgi:hypothetical protein